MRVRPLFIFDLDGTLALNEHRVPLLADKTDPQRWAKFFAACVDDEPNVPVIRTLQSLAHYGEIWVWSGRSDEVREQTIAWLRKHGVFGAFWNVLRAPEQFRMRAAEDFTPDEKLKFSWLSEMEPPERDRLTAVFDDRDKVVKMWREAGVPCFQVAPGEF